MSAAEPAAAPTSRPTCRTRPLPRRHAAAWPPRALSARGARLARGSGDSASARDPALGLLLAGGLPAPDLFPIKAWARCASRVLKPLSGELSSYPPPQGLLVLREQIAAHLAATRGLVADPGCIVVTGGTQQALRTAADLLLDPGDPVWVEDPGYIAGRGALLAAGATVVPVPSDAEGHRCRCRRADRPECSAGAGRAVACHAAGWRAADRAAAGVAGMGAAGERLGAGGRLRTRSSAGRASRCRRWRRWIRPGR